MLKIAAEKNVRPLVQVLPSESSAFVFVAGTELSFLVSKAGEAVTKVKNGDVHYRYVLK